MELTIEKLIYGGAGLTRDNGRVLLAPFVLPNEVVRLEPTTGLHARLLEIVAPSPERVPPPCPHFTHCGGCQYQHAAYEFQLACKAAILREQLRRVGKIDYPGEIAVVAGPPLAYRNRIRLHVSASNNKIGYHAPNSRTIIPIDQCPIASPKINEALRSLRAGPLPSGEVEIFTNEIESQITCMDPTPLDYPAAGELYRVSPGSFFQVNRFLIDHLVQLATEDATGETALDLYAGVGLFSIPLARRFARLTAVESSETAGADLEFNAGRAQVPLRLRRRPSGQYLATLDRTPDFVLADPPRAGLGKAAVEHLLRLHPPRLTIVACDPATLSRDLAQLLTGGYRIASLTMIDLFPHTYHLETVVRLR